MRIRLSWLSVVSFLWVCGVVLGMWKVLDFEKTPAFVSGISGHWPPGVEISLAMEGFTLVMFVHPHCPCTTASLSELSSLMADCQGNLSADLFFLRPPGFSESWSRTDHWRNAGKIPGVRLFLDENGAVARRFHSATSGQSLLYDPRGMLLFQGGITDARGHAGDNVGRSSIRSIVRGEEPVSRKTFVYGCSLFNGGSKIG